MYSSLRKSGGKKGIIRSVWGSLIKSLRVYGNKSGRRNYYGTVNGFTFHEILKLWRLGQMKL